MHIYVPQTDFRRLNKIGIHSSTTKLVTIYEKITQLHVVACIAIEDTTSQIHHNIYAYYCMYCIYIVSNYRVNIVAVCYNMPSMYRTKCIRRPRTITVMLYNAYMPPHPGQRKCRTVSYRTIFANGLYGTEMYYTCLHNN